uniref:Glycosyltransferase n=1 Tax=viral metagenome TaxID=1070528 RepID=A0A6C0CM00_9ZZZZ
MVLAKHSVKCSIKSVSHPKPKPKIHLIVQYYNEKNPDRLRELETCLDKNLNNPYVGMVHNLLEPGVIVPEKYEKHPKFKTHEVEWVKGRMTYLDAFKFANAHLKGCVVGVINLDIYLVGDAWAAAGDEVNVNRVMCLSRHEVNLAGRVWCDSEFMRGWAQDAWIFKSPIRVSDAMDFSVGNCPGCDNLIAGLLRRLDYDIINDAYKYKIYHLDRCRKTQSNKPVFTKSTDWRASEQKHLYFLACPKFNYRDYSAKSRKRIRGANQCWKDPKTHTH